MTYFADLTDYRYFAAEPGRKVLNVGWLDDVQGFDIAQPLAADLELLWQYCLVAVSPTRGFHICSICSHCNALPVPAVAHRGGISIALGSAEIRVFGVGDAEYAAPNLVYHYIAEHSYAPPKAFLDGIRYGPRPPAVAYFELLAKRGLEWAEAPRHNVGSLPFRLSDLPP